MRAHRLAAVVGVGLVALASCAKSAPPDPNDAGATVTVRADDEGVFLTMTGPKGATWVLPDATVLADDTGVAHAGIAAKSLPKTGSLALTVRWENAGPRSNTVTVATPELPEPVVMVKGTTSAMPFTYVIDAPCTGDCTGAVTFNAGQGFLEVTGTSGCTVSLAGETARLDHVPTWDSRGVVQRQMKPLRVLLDVAELKMPDALTKELSFTATRSCPGSPAKELHFTFGRGATITAVWGFHQFVGATGLGVPPVDRGDAADRSAAIVVLEGDHYLSGLVLESDLVRYYGAPRAVNAVPLAGKLDEIPRPRRDACVGAFAPFEVQRCDLELSLYDAKGKSLTRHRFVAPEVDCAKAEALVPVKINWGKQDEVRILRPDAEGIGRFLKTVLR